MAPGVAISLLTSNTSSLEGSGSCAFVCGVAGGRVLVLAPCWIASRILLMLQFISRISWRISSNADDSSDGGMSCVGIVEPKMKQLS